MQRVSGDQHLAGIGSLFGSVLLRAVSAPGMTLAPRTISKSGQRARHDGRLLPVHPCITGNQCEGGDE